LQPAHCHAADGGDSDDGKVRRNDEMLVPCVESRVEQTNAFSRHFIIGGSAFGFMDVA
jgi:hypothetical protein